MSKVTHLLFQSGERYPALIHDDGIPDSWVTLYVTVKLRTSHTALDIRSPMGGAIFSIWAGTVSEKGVATDAGNYVKIQHSNGYESSYSHTDSRLALGASVTQGMQIGTTDMSGASTGPHLHFVLRDPSGMRIDPIEILNGKCP